MTEEAKTFMVEDAEIVFLNFEGKESMYNKAGDRNFCCILDPEMAEALAKDGWNIKTLAAREDEEGEVDRPYIQVTARFDIRPPRITLITSGGRTTLTEESVGSLDWADIKTVDFVVNGFEWDVNGKTGTKAYLKTMFVTLDEDPLEMALERKYSTEDES